MIKDEEAGMLLILFLRAMSYFDILASFLLAYI